MRVQGRTDVGVCATDDGEHARTALRIAPATPVDAADEDIAGAVDAVLVRHLLRRRHDAAALGGVDPYAGEIPAAVTDIVLRGGKRVRPALLWWGWRAYGGEAGGRRADAVLHAAAALELLQACALVHDDLMDGSALRRGGPSTHVAFAGRHRAAGLRGDAGDFGRSAALLAGDLALAWADDLWASAALDPAARERAAAHWRATRTEMIVGQYLELRGRGTGPGTPEGALRVAHLKSGLYSVERPLLLGAVLAGAEEGTLTALRRAGRCAGIAFQLRDDLLDLYGDPARTGKPLGEDLKEGTGTYLVTVALRNARERGDRAAEARLRAALGDPALGESGFEELRALFTELGATAHVERRIRTLTRTALTALGQARLRPPAAVRLPELLHALTAPR